MNFHRLKKEKQTRTSLAPAAPLPDDDQQTITSQVPTDVVEPITGPVNGPINVDLIYPDVPQVEDYHVAVQHQSQVPKREHIDMNHPPSFQQHQQFQQSVPPPPPPPAQYLQHRYEYREPTSPIQEDIQHQPVQDALRINVANQYSEMPLPPLPPGAGGPPPPPPQEQEQPPQAHYLNASLPPTPPDTQSPVQVSPRSTPMPAPQLQAPPPPTSGATAAAPAPANSTRTPPNIAPPPVPSANERERERGENTPTTPSIPQPVKPQDDISMISYLDLSANSSTATAISSTGRLPKWLQKVTGLQYLVCKNLGLSVIDEWVSTKLINLKVLRLNDNKIATWPDHLARLAPFGNLQVLDLEGNPCLDYSFVKSASFRALYYEGGPSITTSQIKKHKKLAEDASSIARKVSNSGSSSSSGGGLFGKKKKKEKERIVIEHHMDSEEDDDMLTSLEPTANPTLLKKKSSFGSFIKANTAPPMSPNPATPGGTTKSSPMVPQDRNSMTGNPDRWTHQKVTQSEINKTKVVMQLLLDIYELTMHEPIEPKDPARHDNESSHREDPEFEDQQSGRSSSLQQHNNHQRFNSLDVLQHYLEVDRNDNHDMIQGMSGLNMEGQQQNVVKALEDFIGQERYFIKLMNEFHVIYSSPQAQANKNSRKAQPCFKFLSEITRLHAETLLGLFEAALERIKQGNGTAEEQDNVLEMLGSRIVSLSDEFHWYLEYALVIEEAKRKINTWIKIRKVDQAAYSYGTALPGYTPTQHHPDNDVAEWLRSCLKHPRHSLLTCADYMDLPFMRIERYRDYFAKFSHSSPSMLTAYHNLNSLMGEVADRKPMAERRRRLQELQKIFRMKDIYGHYVCDLSVVLQSRLIIEPPSTNKKDLKFPDCIYREEGHGEPQARSVTKLVYDVARPPTGTLMRVIVFENTVVVADDGRRAILRQVDKRNVTASIPVLLPSDEHMSGSSRHSSDQSSLKTTGTGGSSGDNAHVMKNIVRIAFWEEMCVWYAVARTNKGSDRDTFIKCF